MITVISLGGSVIVPNEVDIAFLKSFHALLQQKGGKFVIFCGGGKTARAYQESLRKIIGEDEEALDWMGIAATRLNASFVQRVFGREAEPEIAQDPSKVSQFSRKYLIAGGWKPGWSTDFDAVLVAKRIGASSLINVTNVDHVYDKDPREKGAKALEEISWDALLKMTGAAWKPGMNAPFDPIAAKEAKKSGLTVFVVGKDLRQLGDVIDGKPFVGTTIHP